MTNEKRIPLVAEERNEIGEQVPLPLGEGRIFRNFNSFTPSASRGMRGTQPD